jgi:hypothetical protein
MDQWYVQGVLRRMPLPELARAISKKIFKQVRSYFRAVLQLSSSLFADKNKRC